MTDKIKLNGYEYEVKWINNRPHLIGYFANLSSANLSFANLSSANLCSADLRSANLSSANLSSANLSSANLRFANLSSANLSSANLSFANLSSANLCSADLSSAINFGDALNISEAKANEFTKLPDGWKVNSSGVIVSDVKETKEVNCTHTQTGPYCSSCGKKINAENDKGE